MSKQHAQNNKSRPGKARVTPGAQSVERKAPVARSKRITTTAPRIERLSNGDIKVTHSELAQEVAMPLLGPSASLFSNFHLLLENPEINPTNPYLFKWLSGLANNYEFYEFKDLAFSYEMEVPTTAMGSITLAVDYDALNPPPASKPQLAALKNARRCAVWDDCRYTCRKEDLKRYGKARPTTIPDEKDSDERLTFLGNVWLASQDLWIPTYPGEFIPGEFWVHYTILLSTPKPPQVSGDSITYSLTGICTASDHIFSRGNTTALQEWKGVYSNVELEIDPTSYIVVFTHAGYYLLDFFAASTNSEFESDEISFLITSGTDRTRGMRINELDASQIPTACMSYWNASDSAVDDAPWAGCEQWLCYFPPVSIPFRMAMSTVCRSLAAPEITTYRMVVSPAGPRAYPFPKPQTGLAPNWPMVEPGAALNPFPPFSAKANTKGKSRLIQTAPPPIAASSSTEEPVCKKKRKPIC